jgi:outer membrane protein TolC
MKSTRKFYSRSAWSGLILFAVSGLLQPVYAEGGLANSLSRILKEHPLMSGVNNDVATAHEQLDVETSSWLPRLGYRQSIGSQDVRRDNTLGANGTYSPNDISLTMNQLVWDFGATSTAIERARKNLSKEELESATQRINLVLAGIDAHLKLVDSQLDF